MDSSNCLLTFPQENNNHPEEIHAQSSVAYCPQSFQEHKSLDNHKPKGSTLLQINNRNLLKVQFNHFPANSTIQVGLKIKTNQSNHQTKGKPRIFKIQYL